MIQNIISEIWAFLKSPEFTAIVASFSTLWITVIWPLLKQFLSTKLQIKLQTALAKAKALAAENTEIIQMYNAVYQVFPQLVDTIKNQNEALRLAFNNSNLKQDVKLEIEKKLASVQFIEMPVIVSSIPKDAIKIELPEEAIPLKTVPTASETVKTASSPFEIIP
jgi:hypothetical protein